MYWFRRLYYEIFGPILWSSGKNISYILLDIFNKFILVILGQVSIKNRYSFGISIYWFFVFFSEKKSNWKLHNLSWFRNHLNHIQEIHFLWSYLWRSNYHFSSSWCIKLFFCFRLYARIFKADLVGSIR